MSTLPLASEFPAATHQQWLKLVDGVLKGADFDKRLVGKTHDGLALPPLGTRKQDAAAFGRAAGAQPWLVGQRVDDPDMQRANGQALDDLMGGAQALSLIFADSPNAHGFGLKDASRETLTRVLAQISLDMGVTLDLDIGPATKDAGRIITELAAQKGVSAKDLDIKFGFNPFAVMARGGGKADVRWADLQPLFASAVTELKAAGHRGQSLVCDGRGIHAAGGSDGQELAFILACAAEYLRTLAAHAIDTARAFDALYVRVAVDADQFASIVKVRALRRLWAAMQQACGVAPSPLFVVAETAWRMQTRIDPQVNILRNTVAVFGAAVGGADMISVLPHTSALGLPDAAARRLARNTQVILAEESNLFRVIDPGAGSGTIETLTDELAAKAWSMFQSIEAQGGVVPHIRSGQLKAEVAATAAARAKTVATRRDALTGASEFPNVQEVAPSVLAAHGTATPSSGLVPMRLSAPYESLRLNADRAAQAKGQRPRAFLATLGSVADFTQRMIFAKNFYEAGGFEAETNGGFASTEHMVAAARQSGASIAVLCSSDAMYAEHAERAARALTAAGLTVTLAGRPGDNEAALEAAGVRQFIFAGVDVVEALRDAHVLAGIA